MSVRQIVPGPDDERGFALVSVMLVLTLLVGMILVTQFNSRSEIAIGGNYYGATQAQFVSESGAEKMLAAIRSQMETGVLTDAKVEAATTTPPEIPGFTFTQYEAELDPMVVVRPVTSGPFTGLMSLSQDLVLRSTAESQAGARATNEIVARAFAIPIFQFAVFYHDDLEILPGPLMDIRGRVHTNGQLYADGGTQLNFWNMITAAGHLHLHRKASTGGGSDGENNFILRNDASWAAIDRDIHDFAGGEEGHDGSVSENESFDAHSKGSWDHRIQTGAAGVEPLKLPIPDAYPPRALIEPCTGSETPELEAARFACGADLVLRVRGSILEITDGEGNPIVLTNAATVQFLPDAFYDDREQSAGDGDALDGNYQNSNRDVIEIDLNHLDEKEYGVIYVTADSAVATVDASPKHWRQYVVRVKNGLNLKAPLTIATNLPLYVWGHYNKPSAWRPAAFASDAITILSPNWKDALSGEGDTEDAPTDVEISAAILSGHTSTPFYGSSDAGGQFENFPRFLEKWSGKTVTIHGSFVSFWTSQIADSPWSCCQHYSPPVRDWNFDDGFLSPEKLPLATPVVGQILRIGFVRRY